MPMADGKATGLADLKRRAQESAAEAARLIEAEVEDDTIQLQLEQLLRGIGPAGNGKELTKEGQAALPAAEQRDTRRTTAQVLDEDYPWLSQETKAAIIQAATDYAALEQQEIAQTRGAASKKNAGGRPPGSGWPYQIFSSESPVRAFLAGIEHAGLSHERLAALANQHLSQDIIDGLRHPNSAMPGISKGAINRARNNLQDRAEAGEQELDVDDLPAVLRAMYENAAIVEIITSRQKTAPRSQPLRVSAPARAAPAPEGIAAPVEAEPKAQPKASPSTMVAAGSAAQAEHRQKWPAELFPVGPVREFVEGVARSGLSFKELAEYANENLPPEVVKEQTKRNRAAGSNNEGFNRNIFASAARTLRNTPDKNTIQGDL